METEHIDKLFLELSQFTKATTKREADLTARLAAAEDETETARTAARYLADALLHGGDGRDYMQALSFWPWIQTVVSETAKGGGMSDGEKLARQFHTLYESMAPGFGYETRTETREFDPESNNGKLMIAVCSVIQGMHAARITQAHGELSSIRDVIHAVNPLRSDGPLPYRVRQLCDDLVATRKERDEAREQLRQQTKSFCTHCGKLFPKGKEGVAQFREHIAECNKHPLHPMASELTTLRGLLREACIGYEHNYDDASSDKRLRRVPIFHAWYERAQAALEAKP